MYFHSDLKKVKLKLRIIGLLGLPVLDTIVWDSQALACVLSVFSSHTQLRLSLQEGSNLPMWTL